MPTDSEIIMGFFAAYMDSRMPSNYRNLTENDLGSSHFVEDKPFTGIYYVKLPEKLNKIPELASTPVDQRSRHLSRAHKAHEAQTSLTSAKKSIVILQTNQRPPHFLLQGIVSYKL